MVSRSPPYPVVARGVPSSSYIPWCHVSGVFLELYGYCLVVALGQLSGGAITAAPQNLPENIIFVLAMLAGSVIWAIVQGVVCGIITVGDPHYIEHRQNMDQLNFLMADMGTPSGLHAPIALIVWPARSDCIDCLACTPHCVP